MQDKKVALYTRLSIEDEDVRQSDVLSESQSIQNQLALLHEHLRQYPELANVEVVEYKDDGYSGTNFERPKFIELMSDVRKGLISTIVVKDFSRLGRDYLEAGDFLDKIFPAYSVRFISVNDHYDSNTHIGQTTGLDVGFRNIVNDMYSKDISVKKKSAMKMRYKKGQSTATYAFYGYCKNPEDRYQLLVDEEAAKVVRRIFHLSIEGMSSYNIAERLNEREIPSPYEYKKRKGYFLNHNIKAEKSLWDGAQVRVILKDERYLGKMISNKYESMHVGSKRVKPLPREQWIIVDGTHEAIVTEKEFQLANVALQKRSKGGGKKGKLGKRTNLFTCPYCNHKLQFSGGEDNHKYLFCSYGCVNGNADCQSVKVETEAVEQAVLYTINLIAELYMDSTKRKMGVTVNTASETENELRKCNQKLAFLRNKKRSEYMQYTEGKITREQFVKQTENDNVVMQELEQKITELTELTNKKEAMQSASKEVTNELQSVLVLKEYDGVILQNLLEQIYVDKDGKVELVFKRKDILKEIGIV